MSWFYRKTVLLFFTQSAHPGFALPDGVSIQGIDAYDDIPDIFLRIASHQQQYRERFEIGHCAVVGYIDGQPAHLSWIAGKTLTIDEIGKRWTIPVGERCIYDCRTHESYRGRGVYPAVLRWIVSENAVDSSARRYWIYTDAGNKASIQGIEKAGFTAIGSMTGRAIAGWKRTSTSTFTLPENHVSY